MRRKILAGVALVAALLSGCGTPPADSGGKPRVAIVMSGQATDRGFSQMGADAIKALDGEGVIAAHISDQVSTNQAKATLRQLADAGYGLVIGWGLEFWDAVREVAAEVPQTRFVGTGGVDVLTKHTPNLETWTYDAAQLGYLLGYTAGLTQLSPVAVVDGPQAPFLEQQWAGFAQGLKASNPGATMLTPVYTGDWDSQEKARQAASAQIAAGARLVATNSSGYSAGVAAAARTGKTATIGMAKATSDDAAAVNIAWAYVDMVQIFRGMVERSTTNTFGHKGTTSTIANKSVVVTDVNRVEFAPATPADLPQRVVELADKLAAGQVTIAPPTR